MDKRAIKRLLWIGATLIAQGIFTLYLTPLYQQETGGTPFFDISPIWHPAELLHAIEALSSEARTLYNHMQILDIIFPILYTGTLMAFLPIQRRHRGIILLLLSGAFFDYTENLIIWQLLHTQWQIRSGFAAVLPYITTCKFMLIGISIITILLMQYISHKKSTSSPS
jgi:uncharacterized membrane protein